MARKTSARTAKLKRERWNFYKATQCRSSWRSRCKKVKKNIEEVPTRATIESWLNDNEPFTCYISGKPLSKKVIEIDHKTPISRGGSFSLDNVGITSKYYNQAKGSMTLEEFTSLLEVISTWDDKGKTLLTRLKASRAYI